MDGGSDPEIFEAFPNEAETEVGTEIEIKVEIACGVAFGLCIQLLDIGDAVDIGEAFTCAQSEVKSIDWQGIVELECQIGLPGSLLYVGFVMIGQPGSQIDLQRQLEKIIGDRMTIKE